MSEANPPSQKTAYPTILDANEQLQLVPELTKCRVCLHVLKEPVTLSCGNSVCHLCLPPFNPHVVWKFECPVIDCRRRSHLFGDIRVDVTLQKLTGIVRAEVEINKKRSPIPSCLPIADPDKSPIVDDETLLRLRAASQSPSMAFLESDLWSDVESNVSLPPPSAEAYDRATSPAAESPSSSSSSSSLLSLLSPFAPSSQSSRLTAASNDVSFRDRMLSELECQICYMLYYEPITTPCGHTFCKGCILQSIDHADKCPLCRHRLPGHTFFSNHPVNDTIHHVITVMFGRLWYDRRVAVEADLYDDTLDDIPIFVCSLVFPKMPLSLYIFEPRYRLMLRRCLESKHQRFGMVLPGRNGEPYMSYGTMLEISNATTLPDGRPLVETTGSFRFKVVERGMRDGYNVGKVERVDDISPEEEEEMEQAELARNTVPTSATSATFLSSRAGSKLDGEADCEADCSTAQRHAAPEHECSTAELIMQARLFIDQLKATSAPWLLQRVSTTYGDMPEDDADFSWWVASVLPIDEYERWCLLKTTSTRERMKIVRHLMTQLREQWWFTRGGCMVM